MEEKFAGGKFRGRKISRNSIRSGYYFRGRKISRKIEIRENSEIKLFAKNWCYAVRLMHRICAYAVRHVRLTCASMNIAESSCTPRSRMLVDAMMLHPHTSMQSGCGCGCGCSVLRILWLRSSFHLKAGSHNTIIPVYDQSIQRIGLRLISPTI